MVAQNAVCCYCSCSHSLSPHANRLVVLIQTSVRIIIISSLHYYCCCCFFVCFFLSLFQFLFKICSHSSETSNKSMLKVSNNKSAYAATKIKANTIVLSGFVNRFD